MLRAAIAAELGVGEMTTSQRDLLKFWIVLSALWVLGTVAVALSDTSIRSLMYGCEALQQNPPPNAPPPPPGYVPYQFATCQADWGLKMAYLIITAVAPPVLLFFVFSAWEGLVADGVVDTPDNVMRRAGIALKRLHDAPAALAIVALAVPVVTFFLADGFNFMVGILGSIRSMRVSLGFVEIPYRWILIECLALLSYAAVRYVTPRSEKT
jgi:hypothetical protein